MSDVVWRMSYIVWIVHFKYAGFIRSDSEQSTRKQNEQKILAAREDIPLGSGQ